VPAKPLQMSFTGGKLKLKGGEPLKGSVDKKKKKKKSTAVAVVDTDETPPQQQVGMTGVSVGLTAAQMCYCWLDHFFGTKPGLLCTCRMALTV
jgi:hypothetical protein